MSPVVRKWGVRAIAGLFCTAVMLCATALVVVAFAGATQVMESTMDTVAPLTTAQIPIVEPSWWNILDRYGLPIVILAIIGYYARKGALVVWRHVEPLIADEFAERKATQKKQGDFAENANTLLQKSVEADAANAIKIRETHEMVGDLHGVIVKK